MVDVVVVVLINVADNSSGTSNSRSLCNPVVRPASSSRSIGSGAVASAVGVVGDIVVVKVVVVVVVVVGAPPPTNYLCCQPSQEHVRFTWYLRYVRPVTPLLLVSKSTPRL